MDMSLNKLRELVMDMLIISVTERSCKFHYVYQDMTTGLLINIHCLTI